jgi:hypothetical protein
MISENEKYMLEPVRLFLQEIAIVVVVRQASNITSENEMLSAERDFIRRVLLINLKREIR